VSFPHAEVCSFHTLPNQDHRSIVKSSGLASTNWGLSNDISKETIRTFFMPLFAVLLFPNSVHPVP
jgi:hypothetical protein